MQANRSSLLHRKMTEETVGANAQPFFKLAFYKKTIVH